VLFWLPGPRREAAVRARLPAAGTGDLVPVFTATVTAWVRQAGATGTTTAGLAVTVVAGADGWAVYDVEPANAGNSG
jgi:hypothetical protein